jgi:hypothetical protein
VASCIFYLDSLVENWAAERVRQQFCETEMPVLSYRCAASVGVVNSHYYANGRVTAVSADVTIG